MSRSTLLVKLVLLMLVLGTLASVLGFGALVVLYAFIPQSALGGLAGPKAVALAFRHDLVPVGAYFLGRSLLLGRDDLRRLGWTLLGVAAFVAGVGLIDVYAVSIGWLRANGVVHSLPL